MTTDRTDQIAKLRLPPTRADLALRQLLAGAGVYGVLTAVWLFFSWINFTDSGPEVGFSMAGIMVIRGHGRWAHGSARHRWAFGIGSVLALLMPLTVSDTDHDGLDPATWMALAASVATVAAFIGVTLLPGFAPPDKLGEDADERYRGARSWTQSERRVLLGESGEFAIRRRGVAMCEAIVLGVLAAIGLGLAIAAFTNGVWFGGVVLVPAIGALVYATSRAPRIALIMDADGLTVRNLMGTERVPWDSVRDIVAPDDDWYGRLRLKLRTGASISSGALTNGGFRGGVWRSQADHVMRLWGPAATD